VRAVVGVGVGVGVGTKRTSASVVPDVVVVEMLTVIAGSDVVAGGRPTP